MSDYDLDRELENIKAELDAMDAQQSRSTSGKPKKKKKKKSILGKILYFLLLGVFASVFIYCAVYITDYMTNSQEEEQTYNDLADLVNQYRDQATDPTATQPNRPRPTDPDSTDPDATIDPSAPVEPVEPTILPEYQAIYELNNHLVGWIKVPGTVIDYPVVQSPETPDFYLNHRFDKTWSSWGCIYVREECDVFTPSDNVVLYGHHMKDGSMFAALDKYKKKSYWQDHQTFSFDTLYERHTYQIIAVFKTTGNAGQGFAYHLFNEAQSEEEFNAFMDKVHSLQFYDTGVTAQYGDMLLTLSTCEYTLDNGRFVVIAKRIS